MALNYLAMLCQLLCAALAYQGVAYLRWHPAGDQIPGCRELQLMLGAVGLYMCYFLSARLAVALGSATLQSTLFEWGWVAHVPLLVSLTLVGLRFSRARRLYDRS